MDETVNAWISGISDAYIIQWANKGILRRGRKLADKSEPSGIEKGDIISARLENHHQVIEGAGFQFLKCSCPAAGPCHHLAALLLLLKDVLADVPKTDDPLAESDEREEAPIASPPWLIADSEKLRKQLGKARIRRAAKLMMRAVPVELDEDETGLTAVIRESGEQTVRIPRHGGLDASLCSCGATKCVHRTLAVLTACRAKGLFEPEETADDILSAPRKKAVAEVGAWLKQLVVQGVNNTPDSRISAGEALATMTRQADMPNIAAQLKSVCQWLKDEKAGAAHVRPEALRFRLARITAHLTALRSVPMPQPFSELAGVHTRRYEEVRNLSLIGTGAEVWESAGGYCGLTLYLYSPDRKIWYRHSQARPLAYAEMNHWRPQAEFRNNSWATGPAYREIPGSEIRISTGWVSPDHRISGRDGTRISEPVPLENVSALPVHGDYRRLAEAYADFLSVRLFSDENHMPALVRFRKVEPPSFDPYGQVWLQRVFDGNDLAVRLQMDTGPYRQIAVKNLADVIKPGGQIVFGMLSQTGGELIMRPVSIMHKTEPMQWQHLTIGENANERRR